MISHKSEFKLIPLRETELPEGDRYLKCPSLVVNYGFTDEDGIPGKTVVGNRLVCNEGVILGTQCVHFKKISIAAIEIGVNTNVSVIVTVITAATLQVFSTDQFRVFIIKTECEVKVVAVVSNTNFGVFGGNGPVLRPNLGKLCKWWNYPAKPDRSNHRR